MDINRMLSNGAAAKNGQGQRLMDRDQVDIKQEHEYTREPAFDGLRSVKDTTSGLPRSLKTENGSMTRLTRASPSKKDQKHVVFQLIDQEDPRIQARLPMRVMISAHDTTESIITTVKNFYGLYEYGVSFENKDGISIIATYDNFRNDMTVYVRTVSQPNDISRSANSPKKPVLGAPFEARTSFHGSVHSPSRHAPHSTSLRSLSPSSEVGRRSASAASASKARNPKLKSKDNGVQGDIDGYSSDDGANASVASSRRSKTEQVNAEISVDNIVEGGRRKRAFESSELPLFVPPQMPISASISSISPQRRGGPQYAGSPHAFSNQQNFMYNQAMPSPQGNGVALSYGGSLVNGNYSAFYQQPRPMRSRPSTHNRIATGGGGIMPTPDPTVGSAISDEDVALQLMRLGDASNFSYGRTSTSTVDDAFSGKAEAPSSDDENDGVPLTKRRESGPLRKKQRVMPDYSSEASSGEEDDDRDGNFKSEGHGALDSIHGKHKSKHDGHKHKSKSSAFSKPKSKSAMALAKVPMSPASMGAHSRKASIASSAAFPLGPDEEDLSSKPRCQRCRKSKKGCDRQRPCGRCKDAGIGADGCVSEDEGNGRKGRYGRHMGVPVKKTDDNYAPPESSVMTTVPTVVSGIPNGGYFLAPAPVDKSKKRKR